VPVNFYYYTWHLTLRCNRPLKTAIYISLCSTASGEHPLFDPWEKWPPKIHFVLPNLRTTYFLISWSFSTFFTPPSCGLWPSYSYFASFHGRFPKGSSRNSRNPPLVPWREKQTKLGEIVFAIASCTFPSSSMPRSYSYHYYAVNSFSARMKEKLRDDQYRNEKISLQICVFWAYFLSMK